MNDIPMSLNFTLCLELVSKRYQLKTLNSFHKFKLKSSDFFYLFFYRYNPSWLVWYFKMLIKQHDWCALGSLQQKVILNYAY